jgi:DNA-binding response OmpR family regulator
MLAERRRGEDAVMTIKPPFRVVSGDAPRVRSMRVAVIDRDSGFVHVLARHLDRAGAECRVLSSWPAPGTLARMRVNAAVVDPVMAGEDRWTRLGELCELLPHFGVVVCSGPTSVGERVRGLRLGADDWIAKPCHPEEVVARAEASVRSRRGADLRAVTNPLVCGELEIRHDLYQAYAGAACADLTRREFELLELLAGAGGTVIQRDVIYARVWGYSMAHGDRSVDVFVRKLRRKLGEISPGWRYIHTHFGIGYRFGAEPLDGGAPREEAEVRRLWRDVA